jgi:hypothetical protein
MSEPPVVTTLDRVYRDQRGVEIRVTGYCAEKQQVYFTRPGYPHECMQPVWKVKQYFTKV